MQDSPKPYNPKEVEEKWLKIWLDEKLFQSKIDQTKESFSIALPPPNVTGSLHMGHAFGNTIQDVLIRYHRMNGKNVLWQGGTDHAGIGTQVVVEKELSKNEKKKRHDIGREEFLKRVWGWKKKSGDQIINQMQKLGCAMDYDRTVFTMDENYTKAIRKVFVELYKKGLIYRGKRIVNWCPKCLTSISDLEVETEPAKGKLYNILYPFDINDISKGGLTVATSRPETLFGDVAVCVNPDDGRYKKLVGKTVFIPIINKQIPVISDTAVELDFGTGCLKITPAHDANDYEIFNRCKESRDVPSGRLNEKYIEIMSPNGKIQDKDNLGIPEGIVGEERFKAREITVAKLEELGFLKEVKDYDQPSAKHDRCGTVIEPYLSEQWYVKMKPLAGPAIKVVEDGKIKFTPERYKDHYLNWLNNIRDWCISRQLWWGHQIPVWYKKDTNEIYVGEEAPKDAENYVQDEDVLDTWFSSALWPFVTLGWPSETEHLKAFYPTSVLATAREIINLWVSRMVFMGLEFTGNIPFKEVLIHPVIQTPDGKRMSKSKGNAIDPLEMIDKYGADANRFWYFSVGITGNQDVRFPGSKGKDGAWESSTLEQYRRFSNKLWNAVGFVKQNLEPGKTYESLNYDELLNKVKKENLTIADKWILFYFNKLVQDVSSNFEKSKFSKLTDEIYELAWDKFCDWYIEIAKRQLQDKKLKTQTQQILFFVVENILRLLHPIMPFITEEIWESLPISNRKNKFLLDTSYPISGNSSGLQEEAEAFSYVIEITRNIRSQRQIAQIQWTNEIEVTLTSKDETARKILESTVNYIEALTKSKVIVRSDYIPVKPSIGTLVSDTRVQIPISGLVDIESMLNSLNKKKIQYEKDAQVCKTKLDNQNFINNAAPEKIEEVRNQLRELENQIKSIDEQVVLLR
jgi:valyl-tRNA synthetase